MPVRYILSSVRVRLSIFSPLSIIQYVGLYVFSLPISLVMIGRIYILCLIIIIKSEVWTITHFLGLDYETIVSAVCLSIFLSICDMAGLLRGTFVSWWYLPRIWPSVTDMQYYYHTRYPTDDWHLAYMFPLVYFSVEVCLEGVFPHSVSTWRDSCARVYAYMWRWPSYCIITDHWEMCTNTGRRFVSLIVLRHNILTFDLHVYSELNTNLWHMLWHTARI